MVSQGEGTPGTGGATNPYAPPAFDAFESGGTRVEASSDYYVVAPLKFYALTISTYGIYIVYWFYAHFRARNRSGSRLGAALSALFNVFTVYGLFRGFDQSARYAELPRKFRASVYAGPYIVLILGSRSLRLVMPDTVGHLIALGLLLACSVPLGRAQRVANRLAGDEHGRSNARFSLGNLIAIGLGIVVTALAIYGMSTETDG